MAKKNNAQPKGGDNKQKTRLSQTDVPAYSLEQALRVPNAIAENYASSPTPPLRVAKALNSQPGSGPFRMLCGAAIAYGLTDGGYNAPEIKITALGKRITKPLKDGDDLLAKREALLRPRVVGEFLKKYQGSPIPKDEIAKNVLEDLGVPADRAAEVFALIVDGAKSLGLLNEIKGKHYVDLQGTTISPAVKGDDESQGDSDPPPADEDPIPPPAVQLETRSPAAGANDARRKRVFITHGKDKSFVEPIRKLLQFGEMEAVISVEKQSVSQPVPDKVMNEMRSCGAAIIHVDAEKRLMDQDAKEHIVLNSNVLIEIGAAMALFGRRFILLVRDGVTLPSNLQGLYEVRYTGESLDGSATIKLLEAINELKKLDLVV